MKRPHRFEIEITPAFTQTTVYRIETGGILALRQGPIEHRKAMPTLVQWAGFWRLCDFLDLWNWCPEYDEKNSRDGQGWKIRIAFNKSKAVESTGFNSYPSLEDCKIGRGTPDRFGLLLTFIDIALLNPRVDWRDCFVDEWEVKP